MTILQFWISMFFETIVMGKTADLAMIQKTIIDTLHKEGKSQKVNSEGVAVHSKAIFVN